MNRFMLLVMVLALSVPSAVACLGWGADPVRHLADVVRQSSDSKTMAYALGDVHQAGRDEDAFRTLEPLLTDPAPDVRARAVFAIARLDVRSSRKVPLLLERLSDSAASVRINAVEAFEVVDASDPRVVPALQKALRDSATRKAAISAISKIGPGAAAAVPDLVALLTTKDDWVAAQALSNVGPGAKAAIPALTDLLSRSTGYAHLFAAEAIWKIDRNADLAVMGLIESLGDHFGPIRVEAAQMLGEIGPPAAKALPALRKILENPPQGERSPRSAGGVGPPLPIEMTEAEFYPQIERAVSTAIDRIAGTKRDR